MNMSQEKPRVSILIPNYNNGRLSSRDGQFDFMFHLLQSLHDTLVNDPTPVEIIVYDDGSTDDSIQTLREWADRKWRTGQPFLKLFEAEHCGVLSINSNRLVEHSSGDILVRLDGDVQILTTDWASILCQTFDQSPARLGIIGPKQLRPDGRIHAFGDWLLHPKGYHHIGTGLPREAINLPMEVDHVMGCLYCFKRKVFEDIGPFDEQILRGQTIDFGLRARKAGYACYAIAQIEYVHRHGLRVSRPTAADTRDGIIRTLDVFRQKWGFDRLAPDLDIIRRDYAGSPLLWNARIFAITPEQWNAKRPQTPLTIENTEWGKYSQNPQIRQAIDLQINVTKQVISQTRTPQQVAVIGCDAGLITHLLAIQGLACIGVDRSPEHIEFARKCVMNQQYPQTSPQFLHQEAIREVPLDDQQVDLVLIYGQLEIYDNPVALLCEANRILTDQGFMIIISKRPKTSQPQPVEREHRYFHHELAGQINAIGGWAIVSNTQNDNPNQPIILVARKQVMEDQVQPDRNQPEQQDLEEQQRKTNVSAA